MTDQITSSDCMLKEEGEVGRGREGREGGVELGWKSKF